MNKDFVMGLFDKMKRRIDEEDERKLKEAQRKVRTEKGRLTSGVKGSRS